MNGYKKRGVPNGMPLSFSLTLANYLAGVAAVESAGAAAVESVAAVLSVGAATAIESNFAESAAAFSASAFLLPQDANDTAAKATTNKNANFFIFFAF
jgi:hypothetical protein